MKRTPLKRRPPKDKAEAKLRAEMLGLFTLCFVCGGADALQLHHIFGGPSRKHHRCNAVVLCSPCHHAYHQGSNVHWNGEIRPPLTIGAILLVKFLHDPIGTDWERLREIRGQALPDSEPLPSWYVERRERNGL